MAGPKRYPVLSVRPAGTGTCEMTGESQSQYWYTTNFFTQITATPAANYVFDHFEITTLERDGSEIKTTGSINPFSAEWHDGIRPDTGEVYSPPWGVIAVTAVFKLAFASNLILRDSSTGVILRDQTTGVILREGWLTQ